MKVVLADGRVHIATHRTALNRLIRLELYGVRHDMKLTRMAMCAFPGLAGLTGFLFGGNQVHQTAAR